MYDATAWVTPSIEIVDSRIKDWKIKLCDTIADNGSSARFMLGGRMVPIGAVDMRLTGMTLEKNGELVSSGTTAEVWGNPGRLGGLAGQQAGAVRHRAQAGSIVMGRAPSPPPCPPRRGILHRQLPRPGPRHGQICRLKT